MKLDYFFLLFLSFLRMLDNLTLVKIEIERAPAFVLSIRRFLIIPQNASFQLNETSLPRLEHLLKKGVAAFLETSHLGDSFLLRNELFILLDNSL